MEDIKMENGRTGVPLEGFAEPVRRAAADGIVLLKNEGGMLPFQKGEHIAVFGRSQIDYYRNGTGSGGAVNVAYTVNILEGLRAQEGCTVDEELAGIYESWRKEHPYDNGGGGWASEPWHQEEMELSEDLLCLSRERNEKAIVVIGRTAGEDQDNENVPGSYLLTEQEIRMLTGVCSHFDKVAVLLNVSNIIDMSWMDDDTVKAALKAVLYIWQGASEGGNAAADVLNGAVAPSGKLTDTIAYRLPDYPSTKNYGNKNRNYYEEDIYIGYRYFETFEPGKVRYPFGYGLSYTDFEITPGRFCCDMDGRILTINGTVKNTGAVSGKEVVQVYVQAPQGKLGKPAKVLVGFCKTDCLKPDEETEISIRIPFGYMASYDDSGVTGRKSCFVMEEGEYRFFIGNSSRADKEVFSGEEKRFVLDKLLVLEQLEEALAPKKAFKRLVPGEKNEDGSYRISFGQTPEGSVDLEERIRKNLPREIPYTGWKNITLRDVCEKKESMEDFIAQMSKEDLAAITRGEGMSSPKVTPGTAAAFGGVGDSLLDLSIPVACAADGPSGIRMEGGGKATQLPIGTLLAATWDIQLVEELYEWEGREMVRNQIDTLLGPGMNIRRNPLNGRNFEYYSEDPLVTGLMAAAAVKGIRRGGSEATIKHFACNNQEKYRTEVEAFVSERALREIYLKGFEIAVKEGGARSVMSSYNPVNGYWTASCYDLLTTILRKEWGFTGIVMTDWWAKMNHVVKGGKPSFTCTSNMLRAQNDLYMVVSNNGAELNANQDDTLKALERGELTLGELQRAAVNICNFIMGSLAFRRGGVIHSVEKEIAPEDFRDGAAVIKDRMRISMKEQGSGFQVEEEGTFELLANCRCKGSNQMQASCSILINGQPAGILQTNGTGERWIVQKLVKVHLKKGYYEPAAEVWKPGLEVEWIELVRR